MLNKIKIGAINYKVDYSRDDYCIGADLLGEIDYVNQTITIRSDIPEERKENVLIHEIVHGILFQCGSKDYNNEDVINPLANTLYQVLKENNLVFTEEV